MNEVTAGVGEDMALATLDLLAGVIASWAAALGCLDALAVDHSGTRTGLAPLGFSDCHQQILIDRLP